MNTARDLTLLRLFCFSTYISIGIIIPYLPLFFEFEGYSRIQIGTLQGIGPMAGIVSNMVWGLLSDRFRTIKKVLIIVLFGQVMMLLWLWQVDQFLTVFIVLLFYFFFQTPVIALTDSLTLLSVKGTRTSYASVRIWGSIGFAVSAVLMGVVLAAVGMNKTIFILMITTLGSFLLSFTLKDQRGEANKMDFSGLLDVIRSSKLIWFLVIVFIISFAHRTNDHFLTLYLKEHGVSAQWIGWSPMISALSEIPVFLLLGKYADRFRELPLLAFSGFAYTLRYILTAVLEQPVLIIFVQAMHSITFGIFMITAIRYLTQLVPDEFRSSGQALYTVVWSGIAGMSSGMIGGWIYNDFGGNAVYYTAATLGFIAGMCFLVTHIVTRHRITHSVGA